MSLDINFKRLGLGDSSTEKTIFILLLLFVSLTSIPHSDAVKNISLTLAGGLSAFLLQKKGSDYDLSTPFLMPMLLFGCWALIGSLFFSLGRMESLHDFVSHYLKYLVFYFGLILAFVSKKRLEILIWTFVLFAAGYYAWSVADFYVIQGNSLSQRLGDNYPGFVINIEGFITIPGMFFSFFLFNQHRTLIPRLALSGCILVLFLVSLLPQSRGSLLALVLASLVMACKSKKVFVVLLLGGILFFSLIRIPDRLGKDFFKDQIRINILHFTVEVFKDRPITGSGFDIDLFETMKNNYPQDYEKHKLRAGLAKEDNYIFRWPHSSILSILVRTGLIGLCLYLWGMASFVRMSITGMGSQNPYLADMSWAMMASFVAFFIKGLFEPIFVHKVDTIFYLIVGLQSIIWIMDRKQLEKGSKLAS